MDNFVIMYNDEKNPISAILEPLGATGIVMTGDDQKAIILNYEPKESFSYGNIKIRPASVEYIGFLHDLTKIISTKVNENNPLELQIITNMENFGHNMPLAIDSNQISQFNSAVATFSNEFKFMCAIPGIRTLMINNEEIIENGKITLKNFIASNEYTVLNLDLKNFINQANLGSKLSIDKAKEISDSIFEAYPILRSAPLNNNISDTTHVRSIKDTILSRTYSEYKNDALKVIEEININANLLSKYFFTVVALDIASISSNVQSVGYRTLDDKSVLVIEKNEPLRLIYETHSEINDKVEFNHDIGGFYNHLDNLIKFEDKNALIHEVAHAAINILFANEADAYPKEKGEIYDALGVAENKLIRLLMNKLGYQNDEIQSTNLLKYYLKNLPETILFYKVLKEGNKLNLFENYEFESKLSELGISNHNAFAIAQILSLLFDYDSQSFSRELFPKIAELYNRPNADIEFLDEICAAPNEFLQEHIHPKVLAILESHKNECLGLIDDSNPDINLTGSAKFSFCIDEIIG